VTGSNYTECEKKQLYKIGKDAIIKNVTKSDYTECDKTRSCGSICLERLPVTATLLNGSPNLDMKPDPHAQRSRCAVQ
jgi:hypothetical protein